MSATKEIDSLETASLGWATVALREICQINPGKPKANLLPADEPVSFVPMAAVDDITGAITTPEERPFSKVRGSYTAFQDGDVLFAKITPCMENGKAAIARNLVNGLGFGSSEFHVLRPSERVLPEFLYSLVRQKSFRAEAKDNMTGSVGQARVPTEWLKNFELALPSIDEQRTIIGVIGQLQAQMESTSDRLTEIPALLKKFRQSVLAAACSGKLTVDWRQCIPRPRPSTSISELASNSTGKTRRGVQLEAEIDEKLLELDLPETWELATVSALLVAGALIDVKDGNHGANHPKASDYSSTGMPFIMANHVVKGKIDYEKAPKIEGQALSRIRVGKSFIGDVILTHKGSVGRVAVATQDSILTPQTTYYRCNDSVLDGAYLATYLESVFYFNQVSQTMSQTTRDFVPISDQYLKTVIVPPREEQAEIVRRVEALLALADSIELRLADATSQVERTTQAILAKAFRGEL